MIDRKNRYGRTAARIHDADGLARRPSSPTIDIHAHIVIPQAAKLAQPHINIDKNPLARFSNAASREVNAQQESDVREVMTTIDRRLRDLDNMGIDIQVVAPAPGQCYYTVDAKVAEAAHRLANDGVVEYCARRNWIVGSPKTVTRTVGEKVANKVIANVENSRSKGLDRLLAGLGIHHVGTRVAYILATHFGTLDAIAGASQEEGEEQETGGLHPPPLSGVFITPLPLALR